jgi:hypothetical protein
MFFRCTMIMMNATSWTDIRGVLAKGHRVASGPSEDYPYGALERQMPIFKERGLDLSGYYKGTLNVDIHPFEFRMLKPEFTFRSVEWTDLHPPEDFSFSHCRVLYEGVKYEGWVYYPHPETKKRNFQNPSLLEIIAALIPDLQYGAELGVEVNPERIEVSKISST